MENTNVMEVYYMIVITLENMYFACEFKDQYGDIFMGMEKD